MLARISSAVWTQRTGSGSSLWIGQVETDGILQSAGAAAGPATDLLVGEPREPALDLIDPGAVGGREVKLEARVTQQPALDQRCLVGAVIIEHHVDVEVGRHFLVDAVQETSELDLAVPTLGLADDPAGDDVEGREQRRGSVPPVVVGAPLGSAGSHREDGLGSVEGLDLALLVGAEHKGPLWRVQIQPDDVPHSLDQLGSLDYLEVSV